jgi:hypothetical protein
MPDVGGNSSSIGGSSDGTPQQKNQDSSNTSNFYMSQMGQGGHNEQTMINNVNNQSKLSQNNVMKKQQ